MRPSASPSYGCPAHTAGAVGAPPQDAHALALHANWLAAALPRQGQALGSPNECPIPRHLHLLQLRPLLHAGELLEELAVHGFHRLLPPNRRKPGRQEHHVVGYHPQQPRDVHGAGGRQPFFRHPRDSGLLVSAHTARSLAELGKPVGLSISAVKQRLQKLRARGDVRAYVALINPQRLGYVVCAFVHVQVEGACHERPFVEHTLALREVEECHCVSGEFPYLLKVWSRSLPDLERLIDEQIKTQPGVRRTQMSIVLSSPKDQVTGLAAR